MIPLEVAEERLVGMLRAAGLRKKASYAPGEVQAVLAISDRTFWRLVAAYERDPDSCQPVTPCSLDSFMLRRSRRVRFDELVEFLRRNNTYERVNAVDPRQMGLFG